MLDLGPDALAGGGKDAPGLARVAPAHAGEVVPGRGVAEAAGLEHRLCEREVGPHVLARALLDVDLRELVDRHGEARSGIALGAPPRSHLRGGQPGRTDEARASGPDDAGG